MKKHLLITTLIITGLLLSTTTLVAQVTANQPPDLAVCDLDNDGFAVFDLTVNDLIIVGGQTNVLLAYYESQADADANVNPILSPMAYFNIANPQAIFARLEDITNGDFDVTFFNLFVIIPPTIFEPNALEYCDPDNDGFGEFMLSDADLEVTGGIPLGNLVVSYHYILTDALNGLNPLPSPWLNDVPYNQTVHVRLFDQATGCFSLTTLVLVVLDSPQIVQPTDLELYDDNGDGIEVFNLTLVEPELLNDLDPNLYSVYYYEDVNFTIPISNPTSYSNIPPSPQTIYIWVEDIVNSCKSQTEFNLVLVDVLIEEEPDDLFINEGDDDGLAIFDLTVNESQMLGNQDPLVALFSYYITLADSENDVNRISLPTAYQNIANPQTIFVRLTNSNSGNYVLTNFEIETDGVLGINDNFSNSFKIYPNPTTGIINFQSSNLTETVELTLYNLQGQELISAYKTPENGKLSLDISSFTKGIYFIKIASRDVSVVKKIVKQ